MKEFCVRGEFLGVPAPSRAKLAAVEV